MKAFGFFKSKGPQDPLDEEMRNYLEGNLLWLTSQFEIKEETISIQESNFEFEWNKDETSIENAVCFVAEKMNINRDLIEMDFYENPVQTIDSGSGPLYLEQDENDPTSAGVFFGKNENGKYEVAIEKSAIDAPDILLATLAHEFAHIKLLGENRMEENDEMLTDLTGLYFGFGIFGANSSFNFYKSNEAWAH